MLSPAKAESSLLAAVGENGTDGEYIAVGPAPVRKPHGCRV